MSNYEKTYVKKVRSTIIGETEYTIVSFMSENAYNRFGAQLMASPRTRKLKSLGLVRENHNEKKKQFRKKLGLASIAPISLLATVFTWGLLPVMLSVALIVSMAASLSYIVYLFIKAMGKWKNLFDENIIDYEDFCLILDNRKEESYRFSQLEDRRIEPNVDSADFAIHFIDSLSEEDFQDFIKDRDQYSKLIKAEYDLKKVFEIDGVEEEIVERTKKTIADTKESAKKIAERRTEVSEAIEKVRKNAQAESILEKYETREFDPYTLSEKSLIK